MHSKFHDRYLILQDTLFRISELLSLHYHNFSQIQIQVNGHPLLPSLCQHSTTFPFKDASVIGALLGVFI